MPVESKAAKMLVLWLQCLLTEKKIPVELYPAKFPSSCSVYQTNPLGLVIRAPGNITASADAVEVMEFCPKIEVNKLVIIHQKH